MSQPPRSPIGMPNGLRWPDTDGVHINAHGGGVMHHDGTWFWYGEYRSPRGSDLPHTQGVGCYSSRDLCHWKNEGVVLPVVADDPRQDLAAGCRIERPKVIHNAQTGQFVMWFHLELKDRGYSAARTALAVADSTVGPFRFIRSLRPNAETWPIGFPEEKRFVPSEEEMKIPQEELPAQIGEGLYTRRDFPGGQMARDMTLFVDDGGQAYHIAAGEENYTLHLHELTSDYLDFTGRWMRIAPGGHNEAPALFKYEEVYYLLTSGCTGWAPNEARCLTATFLWGPWVDHGNPCIGTHPLLGLGPEKTFGGQSTFFLQIPGKPDACVAMFDVWRPENLIESSYIWLPVEIDAGRLTIRWRDYWNPEALRTRGAAPSCFALSGLGCSRF